MKKYSWIVALLIALSFAFIGCGVDPIDPPEDGEEAEDFTVIELDGGTNTFGGGNPSHVNQQGWASTGFKWSETPQYGGGNFTAKDLGYTLEDFQAAKFLEFEVAEGHPRGGLALILGMQGATDADTTALGGGWNQVDVTNSQGVLQPPYGKKTDNTIRLDLSKHSSYSNFISDKATAVRIVLSYYGTGGLPAMDVKNPRLLIPNTFVEVENVTLVTAAAIVDSETVLAGLISPDDATASSVVWSIMGFLPKADVADLSNFEAATWIKPDEDTDNAALFAAVDFKATAAVEITELDESIYPPQEVVIGTIPAGKEANILIAKEVGYIKLMGIVKDGIMNAAGLAPMNYEKEFTLEAVSPSLLYTYDTPVSGLTLAAPTNATWAWFDVAYDGDKTVPLPYDDPADATEEEANASINMTGQNGLKGRLSVAESNKILALKSKLVVEARITWQSAEGRNGWGSGSFGGVGITMAGGVITTDPAMAGTMTLNISGIVANAAGEIDLNMYNGVNITKIEIWATDN